MLSLETTDLDLMPFGKLFLENVLGSVFSVCDSGQGDDGINMDYLHESPVR